MSCADQVAACRAWAAAQAPAWSIVQVFSDDAISGTLGRELRAGFDAMLRFVEGGHLAPGNAVLLWSLDRFSRDYATGMIEALQLGRLGVHLADTKDGLLDQGDIAGRLRTFLKFLTGAEKIESLRRDVSRGLRAKKELGYWTGRAPYGYTVERRGGSGRDGGAVLVPHPDQSQVVAMVYQLAEGGATACAIARQLNGDKVPTQLGKSWSGAQVNSLLRNPVYAGRVTFYSTHRDRRGRVQSDKYMSPPGQVRSVQGLHVPLVPPARWERVARALGHGGLGQARDIGQRRRPLSGLVVCAACGAKAWICHSESAAACAYRCSGVNRGTCRSKRIVYVHEIEKAVQAWALRIASDKRALRLAARELALEEVTAARSIAQARAPLELELLRLESQADKLVSLLDAGNAPQLVNERLGQVQDAMDKARDQLAAAGELVEPAPVELVADLFQEQLRTGAANLHALRQLIEKITIPPAAGEQIQLYVNGKSYPLGKLLPARQQLARSGNS